MEAMEISEKLVQYYKFHILFVLSLSLMTLFVVFIPRFLTILAGLTGGPLVGCIAQSFPFPAI
jgi:hypothetical protein